MDYLVVTAKEGNKKIWSIAKGVTGRTSAYQEHRITHPGSGKALHIVNVNDISVIGNGRFGLPHFVHASIGDKPIYEVMYTAKHDNVLSQMVLVHVRDDNYAVHEVMVIPVGIVSAITELQRLSAKQDSAPPVPNGVRITGRKFDEQFLVELRGLGNDFFPMKVNFKDGKFVSVMFKFNVYATGTGGGMMYTKSQWAALSKVSGLIDYLEGERKG